MAVQALVLFLNMGNLKTLVASQFSNFMVPLHLYYNSLQTDSLYRLRVGLPTKHLWDAGNVPHSQNKWLHQTQIYGRVTTCEGTIFKSI